MLDIGRNMYIFILFREGEISNTEPSWALITFGSSWNTQQQQHPTIETKKKNLAYV